jgi:hypothetical protein
MSGEGTCVRDISCILIPGEEVVFSVYEGPSAAAVRQLNERARIPVSRIVEAIAVTDDQASLALADQMALTLSILSSKQHRQNMVQVSGCRDPPGTGIAGAMRIDTVINAPGRRHGRRARAGITAGRHPAETDSQVRPLGSFNAARE